MTAHAPRDRNGFGTDFPNEVRDLALRLGACDGHSGSIVRLEQHGEMRDAPGAKPMAFRARQTISINSIAFRWQARCGPLGAVSVTDYLQERSGGVRVSLMGLIPIASFVDSASVLKGESMRYFAELPWAPDAILSNRALEWRVVDPDTFVVSARGEPGRGQVTLRLSPDGLVATMEALARPRLEAGVAVERPWHGCFRNYRRFDGRLVPTHGEVSWRLEAGDFKTWEGEVTSWKMQSD